MLFDIISPCVPPPTYKLVKLHNFQFVFGPEPLRVAALMRSDKFP